MPFRFSGLIRDNGACHKAAASSPAIACRMACRCTVILTDSAVLCRELLNILSPCALSVACR